jgi:TPP-dependent pyruvate/acetoin dehydrogenase alpha subunit
VLKALGVLTEESVADARKEAENALRAGITAAEAAPPADPELLFAHAYVDPPENMRHG